MTELSHFPLLLIMATIMIAISVAAEDPQSKLVGEGCSPHIWLRYFNANRFWQNGSCWKYWNASECSQCVKEAVGEAKAVCHEANGARIHFDGCLLRYENNTFYTQYVDPRNYVYCAGMNCSDPQAFLERAEDLSTQLITNASKNNGYAVGSIDGSLYGLAQCWPSLTNLSCEACLMQAQTQVRKCPPMFEGRGLEVGCFMRYSTYSFFTDNQTAGCISGLALVRVMCSIPFEDSADILDMEITMIEQVERKLLRHPYVKLYVQIRI